MTPPVSVGQASETSATLPVGATPPPPVVRTLPQPSPSGADGGIVVTANPGGTRADPFENTNVQAFDVTQSVDKSVTAPAARRYKSILPRSIRYGLRNFFANLREPVVFLNYLLQLKVGKAAETGGRFGINTTLGLLGLFDTAKKKPFHLPRRNNGFGNTLGFYGVGPGPFLYLPLIGPTTVRDMVGRVADMSVLPYAVGHPFNDPFYSLPTATLSTLDDRVEADSKIKRQREGDQDSYTAQKNEYLRTRQAEIDALHNGR